MNPFPKYLTGENASTQKKKKKKKQSFTRQPAFSKQKRKSTMRRTFYKQFRESGYRNDREMNQAEIVCKRLKHRTFRKPSLIYTRGEWARQIVWPSYERRMAETLEEKEAAGKTPSLTSRALDILKTCPPDKKTPLSSFLSQAFKSDRGKYPTLGTLNPFVSRRK